LKLPPQTHRLKERASPGWIVAVTGGWWLFRNMGKSAFAHLQDGTGRLQIYLRKDDLGDERCTSSFAKRF